MSWSVERWCTACSAVVPPVSWTVGSSDPPLRTTFFGGGQGGNTVEPAFVEPVLADPALVAPALVAPALVASAPVEFVESAGLPTAGFSAVGALEQLEGIVFL